jgi:hypothetical protein
MRRNDAGSIARHVAPRVAHNPARNANARLPFDGAASKGLRDHAATRQHRPMQTLFGIPIMYQHQQFPSRKALAKHLAPLLGRSVAALEAALCRYNGDIRRVVGDAVQPPRYNAIPTVYQGQQFPSRAALADHLALFSGKTRSTMQTLLSRYDGDVERAVASPRRPITFEGQTFPHRKALAEYLAPRASSKPHPTRSCYNRASMKRLKRGACMAWRWLRAIQRRIREHADLAIECAALRHQAAILQRSRPRHLRFGPWDRSLWAFLSQYWPRWRETLVLVQAETVLRWDRQQGGRMRASYRRFGASGEVVGRGSMPRFAT